MIKQKYLNGELVNLTETEIIEIEKLNNSNMFPEVNEPEQSAYAEQRRNAYPEIGDQLDMLWHTMDKDMELQHKFYDFYQTIKKVKVAYPKK
jgi:hypothetical protein